MTLNGLFQYARSLQMIYYNLQTKANNTAVLWQENRTMPL